MLRTIFEKDQLIWRSSKGRKLCDKKYICKCLLQYHNISNWINAKVGFDV